MEQISGFPKNLAFNLKRLEGSIIKQKILINSDKSLYNPNERVLFNFPIGRLIDTRSVIATAKCTSTAGNHFPRGGLQALFENLQITANSRVIQSTQCYNFIWSTLADISGYWSYEQLSKRIYENGDPSLKHDNPTGVAPPVITNACTAVAAGGADVYYFSVSNWLGFLNSSAPTINTNDIGQIQMIITLAPNTCMALGAGAATTGVAVGNYTVEEFTLSMDTITFTNSLYYDLVKSQLQGNGLNIAYSDYLYSIGSSWTKAANTTQTITSQFSTNSLDQVIATFRHGTFNTPGPLLLSDAVYSSNLASIVGSTKTLQQVISDPVANENTYGTFNNTIYFMRPGGGIQSSSWYINSQPFTVGSTPIQIYNNTLQALDYANIDISAGSPNFALTSGFYNKTSFVDILSLENISGDGNNWVSGLGGNGGIINVQYQAAFSAASVENIVFPVIIAKVSKIMNIKFGRNIDIME